MRPAAVRFHPAAVAQAASSTFAASAANRARSVTTRSAGPEHEHQRSNRP
jgi:hypothetical protein